MLKVRRLLTALSLTVMMPLALAACGDSPTVEFSPPPTATAAPIQKLEVPLEQPHYGFTYQRPDGNRYVEGQGNLPDAQVLDIELSGTPQWLVAASAGSGSIWVAVFQDGQTQAFRVECEKAVEIGVAPSILPPGAPPLLAVAGGEAFLIAPPSDAASPLTHPVPLGNSGRLAFIETDGDLVVWQDGAESGRSAVDALPDARLMVDEDARVLLLTKPSDRYPHGIVGDSLEATEITLVETQPSLRVAQTIAIPGNAVVEGISPIWADLNGDGQREIIVTVSDSQQGAEIVVYAEAGDRLGAGPAVGRGSRWRHQLAVAPFGPNGEFELGEVLTPHIGGIAGFYRLDHGALILLAQRDGVTSHTIGSRNLDMGLAGDLDGDGQPELVVFNQRFTEVTALRRTPDGIEPAWQTEVGGKAVTNLAASADSNGGLTLGVGRDDGVLRLWLAH
ncbi:MAG: hypothetical protein O2913_00345 [Chloroflexi bacterium]|nr:hypothetical protein [Chloroflexota bacterium]